MMTDPITVACLCGAATLALHGEPVARAHCHCNSCRDTYGTALLSATAWPLAAVDVGGTTLATYQHPGRHLARTFCRDCGDTLHGTNRLGMRVVPNSLVARAHGGTLPAALAPVLHLYYANRVVDIDDDLPKYLEGWDGALYDDGAKAGL